MSLAKVVRSGQWKQAGGFYKSACGWTLHIKNGVVLFKAPDGTESRWENDPVGSQLAAKVVAVATLEVMSPEQELILALDKINVNVIVDPRFCQEHNNKGCYADWDKLIYLKEPYESSEDATKTLWHEATHALQYYLNFGNTLGFIPTNKGLASISKFKGSYRNDPLEIEAFSVQSSRTYRKMLLAALTAGIHLINLEDECYARLGGR